jgi:hypothetical protein
VTVLFGCKKEIWICIKIWALDMTHWNASQHLPQQLWPVMHFCSMDYPLIQRLRNWWQEQNYNVLGISWHILMCWTIVNKKQNLLLLSLHLMFKKIHSWRTPIIQAFALWQYLQGKLYTFFRHCGLLYFPIINGSNLLVSVKSVQNKTVIISF